MKIIEARNVNAALPMACHYLRDEGRPVTVRTQPTVEAPGPVVTIYQCPRERVLFDPRRDANPFFHFFEALWILAGREDVAWLAQFNSRIAQYSDDGRRFHAAYGARLRRSRDGDQLASAVRLLRREPETRRAVLQLWDAPLDLGSHSKDLPCNTTLYVKLRAGALHLTVCNRSNDIVWGLYGANAVQFSMIQEYLAAQVGVRVGTLRTWSDSFHAYDDNPYWARVRTGGVPAWPDPYAAGEVQPYPVVAQPATWDAELLAFLDDPGDELGAMFPEQVRAWENPFFPEVAQPLYAAWQRHKAGQSTEETLRDCRATDWARAAREWLGRRMATRQEVAHGA